MLNIFKCWCLGLVAPLAFGPIMAYSPKTEVPLDNSHWEVNSKEHRFEEYLGAQSLFLPQGFAQLNEVEFHNGIIEFDIAFPEGRGFPGIAFRIQDVQNYEELYVRPHQSGNPDANQYTPVFNGLAGWQLYHGEGYGSAVTYRYNAWNHIKLVIYDTRAEIFINDMESPLIQVRKLKHGNKKGGIALKGGANSHFANFSYSALNTPVPFKELKPLPPLGENMLTTYEVSTAIEDSSLIGMKRLDMGTWETLTWGKYPSEASGTFNIAKHVKRNRNAGKNTALLRQAIRSQTDQVKALEIGYSDVIRVYVNGKIVYAGQTQFRSRDYRYLGTIGFFDTVYLDLKKGENEIVFAITENFGGWGIKSRLEDLNGLIVK